MSLAAQPRERALSIPDVRPADVADDRHRHSTSSIPFSASLAPPPSSSSSSTSQQQDLPSTEKNNKQQDEDAFDAASRTESDKEDTDSDRSSISGASTNSSGATTPPQTFTKKNTDTAQNPAESSKADEMLAVRNFSLSSSSTSDLLSVGGGAPSLPARSALRTSRVMASIPQKKKADDEQPMLPHAAPHQMYLSSEEDASSSADDFSDFDDGFGSDSESSRMSQRKGSHEDIARVVSVVFSGKPSVITLSSRRSLSTSSSSSSQNGGSLTHTSTEPMLLRNRALSTASSLSSLFHHPPRSTSMAAGRDKKRPAFLSIDPQVGNQADAECESARTPKTPTHMFRKTFGLVKKRSKQTLNGSESVIAPSVMQQVGEEDEEEDDGRHNSISVEMSRPATYQDIMKAARKNAAAATPRSEQAPISPLSPRNRIRSGLSLGRQKNLGFRA